MSILTSIEHSPCTLAELVQRTGFSRATTHRLASSLEVHGLLRRLESGKYALGYRLWTLGQAVPGVADLATRVQPLLEQLRDETGESAQLYVRDGQERVCLAAAESGHGLRTIVEVGARLTLQRGSAGAVFLRGATGSEAGEETWVASVGEREPGVASVSAPVLNQAGTLVAAVSVSGPIERTTRSPGERYGAAVSHVAAQIASMMT